ncbi:tetratricopeptide repeat protein [Thalassotalea eurytherma]|uniref:Tetratricopeptide repeat protein n=1 Tax=Thalassotalea eurytherma TaxID=1144278 RepID=A0ABQ6H5M1_9GAMM|nr:tetratricopeptide repeat protein [Thalassotalea eurytherma]GLX83234.1 hypothetical protein theurythT_26860 [Thalassotalea eurytherma]
MLKKLSTSLIIALAVTAVQLPMVSEASAASAAEIAERKKNRPTNLVGPNIGKKIAKAFELYSADDIDGSIVILNEIKAKKSYDIAYVNRFLGMMYASKGDHEKKSLEYLKKAAELDVLNWADQAQTLKTVADLEMSIREYKDAISHYYAWMEFTGEEDPNVWTKIANAHYSLKQLDKVIMPADKAIAGYGDKHNQNPFVLKVTSYYERKMYPEAVDVLETVIQIFPENKQWWTQLGMFYLLVEDYSKALYTLDLAYKKGYLEKEAQIKTLANLFQSNGVPHRAAKLLEKHMNSGLVTRDDKNLIALANAFHAAQEIDDAAKVYGEVAKMTNDAKHYRKQGMLLKQDEQFKTAIVALNKALDLGVKDTGRVQMSIAESHFYLGQYKSAYKAIKLAMKDPKARKSAKSWEGFIKDTANRKGVAI